MEEMQSEIAALENYFLTGEYGQQAPPIIDPGFEIQALRDKKGRADGIFETFRGFTAPGIGLAVKRAALEEMSEQGVGLQLQVGCAQSPSLGAREGDEFINQGRSGWQIQVLTQLA
jgi:hypothetical protein